MNEPRRFNLVSNGYDCYQVNNEIDRLEYKIGELNEKILMYQNQIETVNNQFAQIKKRYQMLVSELSMREKQADDVARLALKEANKMIEDAQATADGIIQESITSVNDYIAKLRSYNEDSSAVKNQVREAAANLLDALNKLDSVEMPDPFVGKDN